MFFDLNNGNEVNTISLVENPLRKATNGCSNIPTSIVVAIIIGENFRQAAIC